MTTTKGWLFKRLSVTLVSSQCGIEQMSLLIDELERAIDDGVAGDVVEFGSNAGTASVFLHQAIMMGSPEPRKLWCYDSFKGLPKPEPIDGGIFREGTCCVSRAVFEKSFEKFGLELPIVKEMWFDNLFDYDLPKKVCLAFLDCDLYSSMKTSLSLVLPRLQPGGVVILHDWGCPGVNKAWADFGDKEMGREWADSSGYGMACFRRAKTV